MKGFKFSLFLVLFLGNVQLLFSNNTELLKAEFQLENRGEVYYKFYANSINDLINLRDKISIDKVDGNVVIAYANKDEFAAFLKTNLYYEVLTPPSLQGPAPQMSDYKDLDNLEWDKYPTYDGYLTLMQGLQTKYPDKVKLTELGTSVNNKKLIVAKVSDNVTEDESEPAWLLMGPHHGDETAGWMISMRFIDYICSTPTDAKAKRILDSVEMWVLPLPNPDGTYKGGNSTVSGAIRYNYNNKDLNRDYPFMPGCGTSPTPQKETKTYLDWHKTKYFVMDIDWHAGIETVVYPYSSILTRTVDEAWWVLSSRVYADLAQANGPAGYFNDCKDGICNGYSDIGYVAIGTTKDYFYYYKHTRCVSLEVSSVKNVAESTLNNYWNYNREALLSYILESLNGIRGTVTDTNTKQGLKAKIFVNSFDKDSSHVYTDMPHGNYYRPIIAGTYSVTYSAPGCQPKTVQNIKAENGKGTIVNVELVCGTCVDEIATVKKNEIRILPSAKGVKIAFNNYSGNVKAAIYDLNGKVVKTLPATAANTMTWNGLNNNDNPVVSGCYVLKIQAGNKSLSKTFALTR